MKNMEYRFEDKLPEIGKPFKTSVGNISVLGIGLRISPRYIIQQYYIVMKSNAKCYLVDVKLRSMDKTLVWKYVDKSKTTKHEISI